ncbi:MAG: YggT family protein [Parvularculaceae bacterium]
MIGYILYRLVDLFIFVLIADIILGWLVAFGVVNSHNNFVGTIMRFTRSLTEPVLAPARKIIPAIGGIDISPILVIIVLSAIQNYVFVPMMRPI